MENNFTPELIARAKQAKSAEELIALAEENGIALTEEKAREYFGRLNGSGELSDNELDSVSGGGCDSFQCCPRCDYPLEKVGKGWRCRSCGFTSGL